MARSSQVCCSIGKNIVRKPSLIWLVNVEHIDLVVPGPRIKGGRIGVKIDIAWACSAWSVRLVHFPKKMDKSHTVFREQSYHRRSAWSAIHPYRQRSICRIFTRLKEPKERIDVVVLSFSNVF